MEPGERVAAEKIVRRLVADEGFEVFRLTVSNGRTVHLVLDRDPGRVTLKNCVFVNKRIRRALEDAGFDVDAYAINVDSPGVDRVLLTPRHYERFVGERVLVELAEPRDGKARFKGRIRAVGDGRVTVVTHEGAELDLALEEIRSTRLDPELPF